MAHLPTLVGSAVAAGTLAGVWLPVDGLAAALGGIVAFLIAVVVFRRGGGTVVLATALCAAAGLATARGAWAFAAAATPTLVSTLEAGGALDAGVPRQRPPVVLRGRLVTDATVDGPSVLLRVAVSQVAIGPCACAAAVEGQVLLAVAGGVASERAAEWRAGRVISVTATVRRPTSYRNLGAPDVAHDLVRRRVALTGVVKSGLLVEVVDRGNWLDESAAALRARARAAIGRAAAPDTDAAAIGTAVLVGDRAGLDADLTARLQKAGTFHVIAISGGNIALLAGITVSTLGLLIGRGRLTLVLTAVTLVAYAGVVGGGASVLRATGMAVVGLAAQTIDQRGPPLNVLAVTGAALLVADPLLAVDTGFWLTTAATCGLIVGLGEPGDGAGRWRRLARALVLTSVWAELGLLPLVAAAFEQVTVAGVFLSAIAIPGMALAQVGAMAAVVADAVAPGALPLAGAALRLGSLAVTESARVAEVVPGLSWRVPAPHIVAVWLYYVVLGVWLWARVPGMGATRLAIRPIAAALVLVLAVWIGAAPTSLVVWRRDHLQVTVLDVGQGDAIILRFPNGRTMLVDAGGRSAGSRFDIGARVIGPALRAQGIRRLDYLLVTHADADHIGGADALVGEFRPREVWTGVPVAGDVATAALRDAAAQAAAAWRIVQRGDRVAFGEVELAIVHPPPPDWERQRVRNDDSVVLAVTVGAVRMLLTGDIGAAVESEVAASTARVATDEARLAPLTLLKLAHHGSAGLTTPWFLEQTRPVVAIASAGTDNPFGHPSPATLNRLTAARVDVWRTDRDGAITLRTDGRWAELSSFSGRRRRWAEPRPRP